MHSCYSAEVIIYLFSILGWNVALYPKGPFLDILVTPQSDGTFTTKVYRKTTHTDLYLQWDSNHSLASKYSVIITLTHRAKTICSIAEL